MAVLSKQQPLAAGIVPTFGAVTASDTLPNSDGKTVVYVKNASGGSINVTVTGQGKMDDISVPNRVIAVAAGTDKVIGPFNPAMYNDANGAVTLAFSAQASVTLAAFQLP